MRLGYKITSDNRINSLYQVTPTGEVHGVPATIPFKLDNKGLPYIDVKQGVVFTQVMLPTVRVDEVADTATAHADNTSPPSKLLGVSLIAANKPGRRVALDPDRAYF